MQKLFRNILFTLLGTLAGLALVIAISIPIAGIGNTERITSLTNTTIPGINGGPEVRAFVARPQGDGPFPVVIMIHEFFGLNENITGMAAGLAEEGYFVIAPDTFRGQTTTWIPRAIYQVATSNSQQVNTDLDSVYAWLKTQPDADSTRTGIAGFCYGGRVSLLYSLHNNDITATVIFYGSSETNPEILKNLGGPVLGIFGGADASIPLEEVAALEQGLQQAGVPHEISVYDDQPHAFMTDIASIRAGGVQGQAWQQMLDFLETNLKDATSSRGGRAIAFDSGFDWQYYALLVFEHAFGTASHRH